MNDDGRTYVVAQQAHFLVGRDEDSMQAEFLSAAMIRPATAWELRENASSSTMVPNNGRLLPSGQSYS